MQRYYLLCGGITRYPFIQFEWLQRTRAVRIETFAIAGFVPSSIYSRKNQTMVFSGLLFTSI